LVFVEPLKADIIKPFHTLLEAPVKIVKWLVGIGVFGLLALPAGAFMDKGQPIQVQAGTEPWKDSPPPVPVGFRNAVLEGDPKKTGLYTVRAKFPPNGKLAPHIHPQAERVTVLEGSIMVGFGEVVDVPKMTKFTVGAFYIIPAKVPHYSQAGPEGAVIQITGLGPWKTKFLVRR
jgi:quercetin dioxygenase-like cupin family protein